MGTAQRFVDRSLSQVTRYLGDDTIRQAAKRSVLDLVGRAMGRFSMLRPGDRVAVGVSGGKDSLCLLDALVAHRARAPFAYDLVAVTYASVLLPQFEFFVSLFSNHD